MRQRRHLLAAKYSFLLQVGINYQLHVIVNVKKGAAKCSAFSD